MKTHTVGIIMNGVTGRMGTNQHLVRSVLAIRQQGGVRLSADEVIVPEPILVGRNINKLRALAEEHGVQHYTTDLDGALADSRYPVYFDATLTEQRVQGVRRAIAAGKHIYAEKPTATNLAEALSLYREAQAAGVKNGVVQDKLWLPGLLKLKYLIDQGFFGRILSVQGEFGYWVFDGFDQPCQRPSWNYRKEEGGGIMIDMFCHWRYVIDNLFGEIQSLVALGAIHIDRRADEQGQPYKATADDAAYAIFQMKDGTPLQFNSSWCVRVRRDDLLTLHVDGTHGSAGGRPAPLPRPTPQRHAPPGLESRYRPGDRLLRRLGRGADEPALRQRLQGPVGVVPEARGEGCAVPLVAAGGGQGRAVGRTGRAVVAGAALARRAGAGVNRRQGRVPGEVRSRISAQYSVRSTQSTVKGRWGQGNCVPPRLPTRVL